MTQGYGVTFPRLRDAAGTVWQDYTHHAFVEGLREADYEKKTPRPWGEESLYSTVLGNLWHLTYHSAQLNYIQTLLGDAEEH